MATVMVCSLLLPSCRSGLRAITEEPVLKQDHPTTADHVQASGEAFFPGAPLRADVRVSGMLGGTAFVEPVATVVPAFPQFLMGPFTASSGERVLLGQWQDQWQAVLQGSMRTCMHKRMLPVVSSGDVRASLEALQGQGVWSSRSRIHVLSTPPTLLASSTPCVYVGKLGLLGGTPTQQAQQQQCVPGEEHAAEERAKLAEERARLAEERAKLAEERAKLVGERAKSAEERLTNLEKQVLLSQTAAPSMAFGVSEEWKKLQAVQAQQQREYEAKLVLAVQAAEERARWAEEELARLKHDYAEHLALAEQEKASLKAAYEDLLSKQQRAQKQSGSALKEVTVCLADRQASLSQTTFPSQAFGAKAWEKYLGKAGTEPPLPSGIGQILDGACPFWSGKAVKDTHLLVLIPATVDDKPFSLNLLRRLIHRTQGGGHSTEYRFYNSDVQKQFGAQSPERSYWVLMTCDVLEGSRRNTYKSQQALVAAHAKRTGIPYALPGVLEAVTVVLSHYVRSGERLYADDPWTAMRCQELIAWNGSDHPAVVGGFSSGGIRVDCSGVGNSRYGVASLRKL
jgi:hypothetical protein